MLRQDTTQEPRCICGLCGENYDACTRATGCARHAIGKLSLSALLIIQRTLDRLPYEERQAKARKLSEVFQ